MKDPERPGGTAKQKAVLDRSTDAPADQRRLRGDGPASRSTGWCTVVSGCEVAGRRELARITARLLDPTPTATVWAAGHARSSSTGRTISSSARARARVGAIRPPPSLLGSGPDRRARAGRDARDAARQGRATQETAPLVVDDLAIRGGPAPSRLNRTPSAGMPCHGHWSAPTESARPVGRGAANAPIVRPVPGALCRQPVPTGVHYVGSAFWSGSRRPGTVICVPGRGDRGIVLRKRIKRVSLHPATPFFGTSTRPLRRLSRGLHSLLAGGCAGGNGGGCLPSGRLVRRRNPTNVCPRAGTRRRAAPDRGDARSSRVRPADRGPRCRRRARGIKCLNPRADSPAKA